MLLRDYIRGMDKDQLAEFAAACDTTPGQIRQVAYNPSRRAGESLAINIDRESGGAVPCEELRPDVDWGYLRNTQGRGRQKRASQC